jgi:hypothetical protein
MYFFPDDIPDDVSLLQVIARIKREGTKHIAEAELDQFLPAKEKVLGSTPKRDIAQSSNRQDASF